MKGYVYFIACLPLGAVKIGFTKGSPHARLSALQTGCAAPLKMYGFIPASMDVEKRLHEVFAPLHIHGEWFRKEGKLNDFVCYVGETEDPDVLLGALHDVVLTGLWYPDERLTEEEYNSTATWLPFRRELIAEFGPLEVK